MYHLFDGLFMHREIKFSRDRIHLNDKAVWVFSVLLFYSTKGPSGLTFLSYEKTFKPNGILRNSSIFRNLYFQNLSYLKNFA